MNGYKKAVSSVVSICTKGDDCMNDTSKIVSGNFLDIDRESFLRNYYGNHLKDRNNQPTINPIGLSSGVDDRMIKLINRYCAD